MPQYSLHQGFSDFVYLDLTSRFIVMMGLHQWTNTTIRVLPTNYHHAAHIIPLKGPHSTVQHISPAALNNITIQHRIFPQYHNIAQNTSPEVPSKVQNHWQQHCTPSHPSFAGSNIVPQPLLLMAAKFSPSHPFPIGNSIRILPTPHPLATVFIPFPFLPHWEGVCNES